MRELLYTVARTKGDNLIKANDAPKGDLFFCVVCSGQMILKKSVRQLRRPHFAHKHLTQNCTPESALHFSFKSLLFNRISHHLQNGFPLEAEWNCTFCNEKHSGNLLKKVASAKLEYDLTVCKPDITLIDASQRPIAVVEVVVTHSPEDASLKFYDANSIILIQFKLASDDDIHLIDKAPLAPSFVNFCFNPKCPECGHFQFKKYLSIIDANCWKCRSPMKVAAIATNQMMIGGPDDFESNEMEIARQKGVLIQNKYSKTAGESYLANVCPSCHSFIGRTLSLNEDYYFEAINGSLNREVIDVGYYCFHCYEGAERAFIENGQNAV